MSKYMLVVQSQNRYYGMHVTALSMPAWVTAIAMSLVMRFRLDLEYEQESKGSSGFTVSLQCDTDDCMLYASTEDRHSTETCHEV